MNLLRGFVTFDAMFNTLTILLMLVYGLNVISYLKESNEKNTDEQEKIDKLYIVSEYLIKQKMAAKKGSTKLTKNFVRIVNDQIYNTRTSFENWIDEDSFLEQYNDIKIGFEQKASNCIYRLVAFGDKREIKKIYFCLE